MSSSRAMVGTMRRGWQRDTRGVSAVEFAMVSPLVALILAGTVDLAGALYTKFRLDGAVSASANYALVNAANVGSASGASLANTLATILSSSSTSQATSGTIVVNNGPTATLTAGVITSGGTASNADSCYCPSLVSGAVVWGSTKSCGTSCSNGSLAGKYVVVTASQNYTPTFSSYNIVRNGAIPVSAVIQAQ